MNKPLLLVAVLLCSATATAQVEGSWYGVLTAGPQRIPLQLTLEESADIWTGQLQSPTQNQSQMPLTEVSLTEDSLSFSIAPLGIVFRGSRQSAAISGTFQQSAFTTPLVFSRDTPEGYAVTPPPQTNGRPQEPTTFPYSREEVIFPGGAEDVTLAGELTVPESAAPEAVLLLVSGSGPQDRDEHLGPPIHHRPFLVLSDYLTRQGYAVLRYDDRGIAQSTGDFSASTTADFAEDAAAAVGYLRSRPEFREIPLGILGHSEGGLIAPMVAMASSEVNFIILLAGPGVGIDSLLLDQRRRVSGMTSPDEPVLRAAYAYTKAHPDQDSLDFARGLEGAIFAAIPSLSDAVRGSITDTTAFAAAFVQAVESPWMRYFVAFRPADFLEKVSVPVLAMNGLNDTQVAGEENLEAVGAALARAGNDDVTLVPLPAINHLFQPSATGLPNEYGQIETTIDLAVLQRIGAWLDARFVE